jgi:hypothetical protein
VEITGAYWDFGLKWEISGIFFGDQWNEWNSFFLMHILFNGICHHKMFDTHVGWCFFLEGGLYSSSIYWGLPSSMNWKSRTQPTRIIGKHGFLNIAQVVVFSWELYQTLYLLGIQLTMWWIDWIIWGYVINNMRGSQSFYGERGYIMGYVSNNKLPSGKLT